MNLSDLIPFLQAHRVMDSVVLFWIYSAAVGAMPEPNGSGPGYKWLYQFLHTIAGNLTTAFGSKIPGLPSGPGPKLAAMLLIVMVLFTPLTACNRYVVHPGSFNTFDSVAADSLLQAKTLLDNTRGAINGNNEKAWISLQQTYNTARPVYLAYRDAVTTGGDPTKLLKVLTSDIQNVQQAIQAFQKAGK